MSFDCLQGIVIDKCTGAKFNMLENNQVEQQADGVTTMYNTCTGTNAPSTENAKCIIANSWFLFDSGVQMALFLMTYGFETMAAGLNRNQVLGVNALRCALLNGVVNGADLLAAAFLAARQFGMTALAQEYTLDYAYPYYCTCQNDVRGLKNTMRQLLSFGVSLPATDFPPCF